MVTIHLRHPEIKNCQFPGHWESELIKGEANGSAEGFLVERSSSLLNLVKVPEGIPTRALNVLQGFADKLLSIALPLTRE